MLQSDSNDETCDPHLDSRHELHAELPGPLEDVLPWHCGRPELPRSSSCYTRAARWP